MSYTSYQFKTTHKGGVCLSSQDDTLDGLIARYGKELIYVKLRGNYVYKNEQVHRNTRQTESSAKAD